MHNTLGHPRCLSAVEPVYYDLTKCLYREPKRYKITYPDSRVENILRCQARTLTRYVEVSDFKQPVDDMTCQRWDNEASRGEDCRVEEEDSTVLFVYLQRLQEPKQNIALGHSSQRSFRLFLPWRTHRSLLSLVRRFKAWFEDDPPHMSGRLELLTFFFLSSPFSLRRAWYEFVKEPLYDFTQINFFVNLFAPFTQNNINNHFLIFSQDFQDHFIP